MSQQREGGGRGARSLVAEGVPDLGHRLQHQGVDGESGDYGAEDISPEPFGVSFTARNRKSEERARVALKMPGRHNVSNALAAIAAASACGVSLEQSAAALGAFDQRKLLLACLMMRRPKVLLMDEPASGLINAEIDELDLIIRQLVDEYAIGVILIEHRLELLSAVADACVVLDLGEVIATGAPRDVFEDPRVKAAYFEGVDA